MKGIRDLVDAFGMLAARRGDLELCCAGTLVAQEVVRASFPDELRGRVSVRPHVSHYELLEIYRRSDIFVFPTVSEGFSGALLEGMATGLPIVTTPAGAAEDILEDGASALIVPRRNAGRIAESVERLLNDRSLRKAIGTAAQFRAREYEMTRVHKRKLAIYAAILQEEAATVGNESVNSCPTQ